MNRPQPDDRKVIGLGLARTGTTAMHQAMGVLGLRSAPSSAVLIDGLDTAAAEELLANHHAFFDNPIPFLRAELADRFPDARYIITWRRVESWLDSMAWLFGPGLDRLDPETRELGDRVHRFVYGFDHFDPDRLREIHRAHYDELREWSEGRTDTLWLDQEDGFEWEPLCSFLHLPEPTVPFPVANRSSGSGPADRVLTMTVAPLVVAWDGLVSGFFRLCRAAERMDPITLFGRAVRRVAPRLAALARSVWARTFPVRVWFREVFIATLRRWAGPTIAALVRTFGPAAAATGRAIAAAGRTVGRWAVLVARVARRVVAPTMAAVGRVAAWLYRTVSEVTRQAAAPVRRLVAAARARLARIRSQTGR